jgi:proteasome lid subunit RPN8/RPN11
MDERDDRLTALLPPPALRDAMAAHARAAFPAECCGYLTDAAAVACTNVAADRAHAYEIGGAELLALVRGLAGPTPARAIYHSHTNGRAYFSARDAAIAATASGPIYPLDHVVLGVTADGVIEAARFAWSAAAGAYVEVARW